MSHLSFFRAEPIALGALAAQTGAVLDDRADPTRLVRAIALLDRAGPDELSAFDELSFSGSPAPLDDLLETRAGACLVAPRNAPHVPRSTALLLVEHPLEAMAKLAARLHPASLRPGSHFGHHGAPARLEAGVIVDPGACIGPDADIGAGTFVGAGTLIGAGVKIGRHCAIDAGVTLVHALVGDRVTIAAGARLGQPEDGSRGKAWPSFGRVILQNDVEVGANAIVPRGRSGDTIVGEGARLAALAIVSADSIVARGARIAPFGLA